MAQYVDVGDRLPAIGEHHRHIGEHLAPVVAGNKRTPPQRRRHRAGQPDPISQKPQTSTAGMSHHTGSIAGY